MGCLEIRILLLGSKGVRLTDYYLYSTVKNSENRAFGLTEFYSCPPPGRSQGNPKTSPRLNNRLFRDSVSFLGELGITLSTVLR